MTDEKQTARAKSLLREVKERYEGLRLLLLNLGLDPLADEVGRLLPALDRLTRLTTNVLDARQRNLKASPWEPAMEGEPTREDLKETENKGQEPLRPELREEKP